MTNQRGGTVNWRTISAAFAAALLISASLNVWYHFQEPWQLQKAPVAELFTDPDGNATREPPKPKEQDYGEVRIYPSHYEVCTFPGAICTVKI